MEFPVFAGRDGEQPRPLGSYDVDVVLFPFPKVAFVSPLVLALVKVLAWIV